MKIDRNKLKKGTSEVPSECRLLIDRLRGCSDEELLPVLKEVKSWTYGKCELYHWADVLDLFDGCLERACKRDQDDQWTLPCDAADNSQLKELLLLVLGFTALLIEHSFSRHLYNSMEHLATLMASDDMSVVLAVLNLLYVFSKRSNFITRLAQEKKQALILRLTHLAESWGGKDNGFGLAACCQDLPISSFPSSATTLHFEFYEEKVEDKASKKFSSSVLGCIHIENVDKIKKLPSEIMEDLVKNYNVPESRKVSLLTHVRLAHSFSDYEKRVKCVQARLQAISVLVYSNAMQDNVNTLLYGGFIEELVDILQVKDARLVEIKAPALRTLTSVIHLERNPKLNAIIDATGASSYHGFLPVLVRTCIQQMTGNKPLCWCLVEEMLHGGVAVCIVDPSSEQFPQPFSTSLFSFLYHLASYESGGEALVSCGMMESLLKVINWYGDGSEHITFVTRAVRVVDLITNLDMTAFQAQSGLNAFINRLEHEVEICRREQPFVLRPRRSESVSSMDAMHGSPLSPESHAMETDVTATAAAPTTSNAGPSTSVPLLDAPIPGVQCFPQRAALLKSMLNFLKKATPDPAFSDNIRHLMDGSLPRSLKHIISNAEYYGPSLFLLATDVVTVYVFQEPSLLSSLQDKGLTDVVLHALLVKDVPATREVLASLPNVFSALCLNARGLESFVQCKPFERLFKVLLSEDYLPAMRRRRSSDPLGDTASNLGNAMDELMRHQPSLRVDATRAIIKLLEEVGVMGRDSTYICLKPTAKAEVLPSISLRSPGTTDTASSEDEDEDEEMGTLGSKRPTPAPVPPSEDKSTSLASSSQERKPIPLMDYVLNVMKFVEAILSNNTTDDHCREFVNQKGLLPLMGILGLPNLPIDFPASQSCQAVASVCKSILTLSHEPQVLKQGLLHLNEVLQTLEPLHRPLPPPGGSVLLKELASSQGVAEPTLTPLATPLLHALASAHAYIMMFVHVCRVGQSDIRTISVSHWGSELGLEVLRGLSQLYTSLVWESTVLLALCSDDILPATSEFGRADMDRILPKEFREVVRGGSAGNIDSLSACGSDRGSNGVSAAMESLSTTEAGSPLSAGRLTPVQSSSLTTPDVVTMDVVTDDGATHGETPSAALGLPDASKKTKMSPALQAQIKQIKPLLSASSRLGRALAELFGLLVKLCVGSPVRQRRTQQVPAAPTAPTPAARSVATALTKLLANGLLWEPPATSPVPKLRLTFFICSVGFTSPMLFDEKKCPYHLMLQKFVSSGGQDALFKSFEWALTCGGQTRLEEGLENPNLPDGTGEFFDAWLMLIEKMVNTKNVLESPHTLPVKSSQPGFTPFSPVHYLVKTHKAAFSAISHLWNRTPLKTYGGRMSESILAILCHIIKGEALIKEKLVKEKEDLSKTDEGPSTAANNTPVTSSGLFRNSNILAPRPPPAVNESHLSQLMDMGFTHEHCTEALQHTANLEQATEWLLSHPPSALETVLNMSDALSEEEQMMRAIAMSLGENVLMSTDQQSDEQKKTGGEELAKKVQDSGATEQQQQEEEPLSKDLIDDFTNSMLPGCLQLLDTLPETVYRVCDLIVVVTNRNGFKWRNEVLLELVAEIVTYVQKLLEVASQLKSQKPVTLQDWINRLSTTAEAGKLATRLHLLTLLFEEMKMSCAEVLQNMVLMESLVQLLDTCQYFYMVSSDKQLAKDTSTPKWLAPLLLLLDQYEKVSVASKRKAKLRSMPGESHTWKWFDDRTGKWQAYPASNNKVIDDMYRAGEPSVRFTAGRRRYTIQFSTLVQVNEESGNRRPIMLALPTREERSKEPSRKQQKEATSAEEKDKDESKMDVDDGSHDTEDNHVRLIEGLTPDQMRRVVRASIALLSIPVEPDTLHACLRLCLRLTRAHEYARQFGVLGGPRLLLGLTCASDFQGFTSLASLLLRHVLEEPATLRQAMEKAVRLAAGGIGSSSSGVSCGSHGSKEMNYVLRCLGPAACRHPVLFTEVAKNGLCINLPLTTKKDEDLSRLVAPSVPQILKAAPKASTVEQPTLDDYVQSVLIDLLNALTVKNTMTPEEMEESKKGPQSLAEAICEVVNSTEARLLGSGPSLLRNDSGAELTAAVDDEAGATLATSKEEASRKEAETKEREERKRNQPLLPKSAILRLLAEMVRSYAGVGSFVAQHTYSADLLEEVTEDCSVLAFVLDHFLPQCQRDGDKDCPALARVLIASLASCATCVDTQTVLVNEVKSALQRALVLQESAAKHARVQALASIVSTMIEACPSPGQVPNQIFKSQQPTMNAVVRVLVKRNLVQDLARIPHSLDLSSPHMAATVNSALKPLETLSRIVNQPQPVAGGAPSITGGNKSRNQRSVQDDDDASAEAVVDETAANNPPGDVITDQSTVNTAPSVRDEGDVTIEDVTDTLGETECDETHPLDAVEPVESQLEHELDDVLDELLQREADRGPGPDIVAEIMESDGGRVRVASRRSRGDDDDDDDDDDDELTDVEVECVVEDEVGHVVDRHDSQMLSQLNSDDEGDHTEPIDHEDDHQDDTQESGSDDDDDDEDRVGDNGDVEDDEDIDDDDDDDDDEDDEGSDMEADNDDFLEMDDLMAPDNDLFVHLEDMLPPGRTSTAPQFMFGDSAQIRTYQLPILSHDVDTVADNAVPSIPPAPSNVVGSHPLLVRHPDTQAGVSSSGGGVLASRVHRAGRPAGSRYRYNPNTQTLHVHYNAGSHRHPNPPAILQRLIGQSAAHDILQLTSTLGGHSMTGHTRLVVANDDLRVLRSDEDVSMFEDLFSDPFADLSSGSGSGILSSIPSVLSRWTEESRVLDNETVQECVMEVRMEIIDHWEQVRDAEIAERQEKRSRELKEREKENGATAAAKTKGDDGQSVNSLHNKTIEWSTPRPMETQQVTSTAQSQATPAEVTSTTTSTPSTISSGTTLVSRLDPSSIPSITPSVGLAESHSDASQLAERIATAVVEQVFGPPVTMTTTAGLTPSIGEDRNSPLSTTTEGSTVSLPSQEVAALMSAPVPEMLQTPAQSLPIVTPAAPNRTSSSVISPSPGLTPLLAPGPSNDTPMDISAAGQAFFNALRGPGASLMRELLAEEDPDLIGDAGVNFLSTSNSTPALPVPPVSVEGLVATTTSEQPRLVAGQGSSGQLPLVDSAPSTTAPAMPEGVDPSFLAALPDSIRQEVIAEQLRLQRIQQRVQQQSQLAETLGGVGDVNPEFLAALPPAIQEEVLAQQRAEQARIQAQSQPASSTAVAGATSSLLPAAEASLSDPAGVILSLPASLRRQVLADMDDSMVAVLSPELAAEAQALRTEREQRQRREMQERLFAQGLTGRFSSQRSGFRFGAHAPRAGQWGFSSRVGQVAPSGANSVRLRGRHLLDHEALTCLLVLLFVDEPKLNTSRLHRVLRNLCYHAQTRTWVLNSLIAILQRTAECRALDAPEVSSKGSDRLKRKSSSHDCAGVDYVRAPPQHPSWLSIGMEAALGCRANVFQIHRTGASSTPGSSGLGKKHGSSYNASAARISIHPQSAGTVCRHVLDTLISLAKSFPNHFLPSKAKEAVSACEKDKEKDDGRSRTPSKMDSNKKEPKDSAGANDFWELLLKLDHTSASRKGKNVQRTHSGPSADADALPTNLDSAPIGLLMAMLAHPVIRRSQTLTDRLLRLLGLVSIGLPDLTAAATTSSTSTTVITTTAASSMVTAAATTTTTSTTSLVVPAVTSAVQTPTPPAQAVVTGSHSVSEVPLSQEELVTSTPLPVKDGKPATSQQQTAEEAVLETQLQLAVEVLTSKACSEEGLEDATHLLLQLSRANSATCDMVLKLLLSGARELGSRVCEHIRALLSELQELMNKLREVQGQVEGDEDQEPVTSGGQKGQLPDRYESGHSIVVSAPKKVKAGRDLQVPSMSLLTTKTSSQQFLLRILKVIIQLREAARNAQKKAKDNGGDISFLEQEIERLTERVEAAQRRVQNPVTDPPMDVDQPGTSTKSGDTKQTSVAPAIPQLPCLSEQLQLDELWEVLGECLSWLAKTPDQHAVLVLQPAVEAFFIVHAGEKEQSKAKESSTQRREDQLAHLNYDQAPMSPGNPLEALAGAVGGAPGMLTRENSVMSVSGTTASSLPPDTQKFVKFAETHHTVLNQILRQSSTHLADGPFAVLVNHTRVLDFDVKRRYFRQELERMDEGVRLRREDLAVHIRRDHVFEDSFRELLRRSSDEWKHRFYIVFEGEEGQDAGGLLREWYLIISREIFNPMYALFLTSPGDRVTYTINPASHCNSNHLSYFKFVGRVIAKAIYDNKLLECYFTRSFYKHIMGKPVKYTDMESEDYSFYQGLVYLMENDIDTLGYDLTFSTEIQEFGVTEIRDLKPDGHSIPVTEETKAEYVKLVCQMKMTGAIRQQLNAFLEGFYDVIPKRLISIFNEHELELLISGLPTVDIDDLKANTEYHKYQANSLQIIWFWRALRSFDQAERANFLQFVTGTSKVPLQGFAHLEGMNGVQRFQVHRDDRSTDRLPCAHTCFNQLDLPAYETYDKLRNMLLLAINECSEGFGLA